MVIKILPSWKQLWYFYVDKIKNNCRGNQVIVYEMFILEVLNKIPLLLKLSKIKHFDIGVKSVETVARLYKIVSQYNY